jgi:hypothetical protein
VRRKPPNSSKRPSSGVDEARDVDCSSSGRGEDGVVEEVEEDVDEKNKDCVSEENEHDDDDDDDEHFLRFSVISLACRRNLLC